MAWTDERVEALKKLWQDGLSASQIANQLGEVSRNAVIGKVHRLGLAGRATTSRVKVARQRPSSTRVKRQRPTRFISHVQALRDLGGLPVDANTEVLLRQPDELVIPLEERASILTLKESSCRWPIGDPQHEDFHFCGRQKVTGVAYCEFHANRAFQPVQPRRRDQDLVRRLKFA